MKRIKLNVSRSRDMRGPTISTDNLLMDENHSDKENEPLTPTGKSHGVKQGTDNITFIQLEQVPDNRGMASSENTTPILPATPPGTPANQLATNTIIQDHTVEEAAARMERTISQGSNRPIDIAVYFPDNSGIVINVLDGKNVTVSELMDLVIEEKNLPALAKNVFDLWFVSPHLALQLKKNHVPFRLACKWDELLIKYTKLKEHEIERDEPVLTFMRNVSYPPEQEEQITNPAVLSLLFQEARAKILHGLYPCDSPAYINFGGLIALEEFGAFNSTIHTQHFYDQHIKELLPPHQVKRKLSLKGKNPREQLQEAHKQATLEYSQNLNKDVIHKDFLKVCWEFPFYGSAFFGGQIETPRKGVMNKLIDPDDTPVRIAINRDGVYVIDPLKVSLLLGLTFKEFSWEYAKSLKCDTDPEHCLPCLFLQFEVEEHNELVSKMLQIFSKQALLMDALIDSFVGMLTANKDQPDGAGDEVDGTVSVAFQRQNSCSSQIKAAKSSSCLANKFNKLSLQTVVIPE